ncbi:hypothetical protein [Streptomyces poonensis]|uniref:hypothetical protein n=1 Tax=Streptomyces poonensis TaxID=68255 RepID=UPI001678F7B3|nr:hypothetical protein [Streptomyces poonensis]
MEYDLPNSLCGVPVDRSVIEPIFPPGKELTQEGGALPDGQDRSYCSYLVDGNTAVSLSDQRYQEKLTARDVIMKTTPQGHAEEVSVVASGDIALYRGHAVGVTACSGFPSEVDGEESRVYAVMVGIGDSENWQEAQTKLTQFMEEFLPAAAQADRCSD